ncbi:MAG: hypothetical protein AAGC97_05305 [Planctomycetota bacterium]
MSPAKAGGQIECSQCDRAVDVPKLGELRQLPPSVSAPVLPKGDSGKRGMPVIFAALAMLAAGMLLAAGYSAIRYAIIEVPIDTVGHIAQFRDAYQDASSAQLVREWEDITERDIDLPTPYRYRTIQLTKAAWGRNALILALAGLASFAAAVAVGRRGRTDA